MSDTLQHDMYIKCWKLNHPFKYSRKRNINTDFLIKKLEDMRSGFSHEQMEYKNLASLARFIRAILREHYDFDKFESQLTVSNNDRINEEIKNDSYDFYRLNVYYLYLTNSDVSIKDAELTIYKLRQFINYLTVHSWGNCKRLSSLFESFTKPVDMFPDNLYGLPCLPKKEDTEYMLNFGITETQRITMGSNLYIMFNHHLSRQFSGADKLAVSTLAALHYCLKFHRSAFSRHHLFRMTEMMSIYSSPELNSIFETTLTQVLWPYIRVIRNGMFRYRFFTWIEQEIRYIARVNDLESASYTFSLDAINDIKAHYRKTLDTVNNTYETIRNCSDERGPGLIAELNIVLGDIYFLERSYGQAVVFYQTAVNAHHNLKRDESYHLECLFRFVEALLKLGSLQEHRQRYERAAMNYYQAIQLVDTFLMQPETTPSSNNKPKIQELIESGDPKWNLLKQPYWCFLYLDIKRGRSRIESIQFPENIYRNSDQHLEYLKGQLNFYLGNNEEAQKTFLKVCRLSKDNNKHSNNSSSYLIPTTCTNLAENALVWRFSKLINPSKSCRFSKFIKRGLSQDNPAKSWQEDSFVNLRKNLIDECYNLIESMESVKSFEDLKLNDSDYKYLVDKYKKENNYINMRDILMLLFYAAKQYEYFKLYDHAAMAYIKAISIWVVTIDLMPLNHLDSNTNAEQIKKIVENVYCWLDEASKKALNIIMDTNGHSRHQALEKWRFRDISDFPKCAEKPNYKSMGYNTTEDLHSDERRQELSDDITFFQGSYLGQQLMSLLNWAHTINHQCSLIKRACGTNLATRELIKLWKDLPVMIAF